MTEVDAERLARRLALLAEIFNEAMSPTRLAGYRAALNDLAFDDIVPALNDCAKTCIFFPKPAEIRERVKVARLLRQERERALWLRMRDTEADARLDAHAEEHTQALLESVSPPTPYDDRLSTMKALITKLRAMAIPTLALPASVVDQEDRVHRQIAQWRRESGT